MWIDVATKVFHSSSRRVKWNEVSEDPANRSQSQTLSYLINSVAGMLNQFDGFRSANLQPNDSCL
jgi:hypothetical protein